ncbi:RSC complex subunit Sfh1 [Blumeria hordei DH14]|uniref:RSC complex subunit Sfh1 n=1 Tax=Blumeria graminis f. sp. hordei (strain DH14) TaxID=546991 RepID=N1JMZ3_BLUG1|nr:RSC complex subunit Sfh1 [Blumeria hordei DH14]
MASGNLPQSFISSYAPRLRTYNNALLTPVIPPVTAHTAPLSRTTKRGTTAINYAEDGYDDYEEDEDEGRKRPTGLRSIRRDEAGQPKQDQPEKVGKEATAPVEVQGIWRDWMGKSRYPKPDYNNYAQTALPLILIPIRIDLDIPAFIPAPPLPIPQGSSSTKIDHSSSLYRSSEMTVPYRLKDIFLWNLHETLTTTDQFAQTMVQDLDLPHRGQLANEISKQIRTQLEEYSGVALHPLFHSPHVTAANGVLMAKNGAPKKDATLTPPTGLIATPAQNSRIQANSTVAHVPSDSDATTERISASASSILPESNEFNPDDMYRCIINLTINLSNHLYTDKFEWSLLHPPGTAEIFAKQTCADLGLPREWVPVMAHAIYESVLRLKKDACESGGLVSGCFGDIPNEAAHGAEAGWRYDNEHLADEWEPKVEQLSKEEIEKREGDRERQIRRLRRETARFPAGTAMIPQLGDNRGYFEDVSEERMGRGERSKKKRRFRSLSPLNRSGTPVVRSTPDVNAAASGSGSLNDYDRSTWRCSHCKVWGTAIWAVRDGPQGPRVSWPSILSLGQHRPKKLTHFRRSATTVDIFMSAIVSSPSGLETFTSPIYERPIIDENMPFSDALYYLIFLTGNIRLGVWSQTV